MHERQEREESSGEYVDDGVQRGHFGLALHSSQPPFHALVDYDQERGGMPLHDAVGVKYKNGEITENQETGAWYMG